MTWRPVIVKINVIAQATMGVVSVQPLYESIGRIEPDGAPLRKYRDWRPP